MSLKHVTAKGGADLPPTPAGVHAARCYAVIDMGTSVEQFGNFAPKRKVVLIFEIPSERITVEREDKPVDLPRTISTRYTQSLSDKANLRHDLEAWRGRPFTPAELEGFDMSKVLGAPALVNVVHRPKKAGGISAVIASISPLPKGMVCPPAENPQVWFDIDDLKDQPTAVFPAGLPKWCEEEIRKSEEFTAWQNAGGPTVDAPADDTQRLNDDADFETARQEVAKEKVPF